jgi:hypothetical protein
MTGSLHSSVEKLDWPAPGRFVDAIIVPSGSVLRQCFVMISVIGGGYQ